MQPVVVSWTAQDYLNIGLRYLTNPDGIIELVHNHNQQFAQNPDRNVVFEEAYKVAQLVAQIVEWYWIERSEYYRYLEKLIEDSKLQIEVRDYPMEALTKRIQEVWIPKRIINILERNNYKWMFELVRSCEDSFRCYRGMWEKNAATLRECVKSCGLDLLWDKSDIFLKRDFRFRKFYEQVTGWSF